MNDSQAAIESAPHSDIMPWFLELLKVVNAGGKLAPEKAITKALQQLINTFGDERVLEGVEQLSLTFNLADALRIESLFQSHPNLPEILKTDNTLCKELNDRYEQHTALVTRVHKISSTILRLSPAVEWEVRPSPDCGNDLRSITEMLFHNKE